ncbi:MAG: hypothetical protein AAF639_36075, partial [Chloroflexota bacterium]
NIISSPLRIGLGFGLIGILLTLVGIARGNVPMNPASMGMALLIGGGMWFLVSWAVATAATDVEQDIMQDTLVTSESNIEGNHSL